MKDSILKRSCPPIRSPNQPEGISGEDTEEVEDVGFFGWLRGTRDRAVMLELRKKDGSVVAYDYAILRKVELDPSQGVTLHFSGEAVKIIGRKLKEEVKPGVSLVRGLLWHRIPWIREASDAENLKAGEAATVIERNYGTRVVLSLLAVRRGGDCRPVSVRTLPTAYEDTTGTA